MAPVHDLGLTHVALNSSNLEASAAFWERYARMQIVHRRDGVLWLSDKTRPFVIVLLQTDVTHVLGGWAHLGVAVESRDEVDRRVADARDLGHTVSGPYDEGPPVGYWAIIADPDGHHLELAYGQEVGVTVAEHRRTDPESEDPRR